MRKAVVWLLAAVAVVVAWVGARESVDTDLQSEIIATFRPDDILTQAEIDSASRPEIAMAVAFGRRAFEAERRYPGMAESLYEVYGQLPEFTALIERYGFVETMPIIASFVENPDALLAMEHQVGHLIGVLANAVAQQSLPEKDQYAAADLTPQLRGLYVIDKINDRGHAYLAGWEVVFGPDGTPSVHRNWTQTIVETGVLLTLDHVRNLERRLARNEATLADKAWAAADIALLAIGMTGAVTAIKGGGKAVAVSAKAVETGGRMGKIAHALHVVHGVANMTRAAMPGWAVTGGKAALVAGGIYTVYHNPLLVPVGVRTVAQLLGIPEQYLYLVVFVFLCTVLAPSLTLLGLFVTSGKVLRFVVRILVRPLVWLGIRISRRAMAGASARRALPPHIRRPGR